MENNARILERLGIGGDSVVRMTEGTLNYVFRGCYNGQDSVIKIFNPRFDLPEERFRSELHVLIQPYKISLPKLLAYSEEERWIITKFVEGECLRNRWGVRINTQSLVDSLKSIYETDVDMSPMAKQAYLDTLTERLTERLQTSELQAPLYNSVRKAIEYLKRQKSHLREGLCRVNGDMNGGNILLNNNGEVQAIVDWEFSHVGSLYLDMSHITNREGDFSNEIKNAFFEGKADEAEYDFFTVYFLVKIVLNNALNNAMNFIPVSEKKQRIVARKAARLQEMF